LDILPLVISIEERSYLDGEEIHIEEVYAYMRKGSCPKRRRFRTKGHISCSDPYLSAVRMSCTFRFPVNYPAVSRWAAWLRRNCARNFPVAISPWWIRKPGRAPRGSSYCRR
jgi:hypothetical protein